MINSQELQELLKKYNITQKQFAQEARFAETQVSKWMHGVIPRRVTENVIRQYFAKKALDFS